MLKLKSQSALAVVAAAALASVSSTLTSNAIILYDRVPTYELEVYRERSTGGGNQLSCSLVAIHETQVHKDLAWETDSEKSLKAVVSSSSKLYRAGHPTGGPSYIDGTALFDQHFSHNLSALLSLAKENCGLSNGQSSTTVYIGSELPLPLENDDDVVHGNEELVLNFGKQQTVFKDGGLGFLDGFGRSEHIPVPDFDVIPLIVSGPSSNRIDFVFFGDGCKSILHTAPFVLPVTTISLFFDPLNVVHLFDELLQKDTKDEKPKFVKDAQKLADDLAYNETFATVRPLMNFWAAFTPSNEVCPTNISSSVNNNGSTFVERRGCWRKAEGVSRIFQLYLIWCLTSRIRNPVHRLASIATAQNSEQYTTQNQK
jgi:hypothetical protein